MILIILLSLALLTALTWFWIRRSKRPALPDRIPAEYSHLLQMHVKYYRNLSPAQQEVFTQRVAAFLKQVHIEGVGTEIDLTDKILVAASAIIPVFGFGDWKYPNLTNIILYPHTFNEKFQYEGAGRSTMGMVGSGYMNGQMILSKPALHAAYALEDTKHHTPIHEFVHLLDKTDGATDGIPEYLMEESTVDPWLDLMHREMIRISQSESDINAYALTGDAEFFAVVSEYFFQQPQLMAENHPEIYKMLCLFYKQDWVKERELPH
ncbi:zinc-dependent peptidase [Flavihumibacter sp. R14]|nr:zinc-dependent peptidase [Flavihumibacter soli]